MSRSIPTFEGYGLGLRREHYRDFLDSDVPVDFVEVISENFMIDGGQPLDILRRVRERHPVILHGVSMSIGSADGLRGDYLKRLRKLVDAIEPLYVSDHLSWSRFAHVNSHDLLPLPYTEETLAVVCRNIDAAQEAVGRPMLFENPSSYVSFAASTMTEWEFLAAMAKRTGCGLLLDVNNIYVSARNHGWDAHAYLRGIPADRVRQIHLAGHTEGEDLLIDTHDQPVSGDVWALYAAATAILGPMATMIERDDAIPPLPELLAELDFARGLRDGRSSAQEAA
jgi:hypothetical protein